MAIVPGTSITIQQSQPVPNVRPTRTELIYEIAAATASAIEVHGIQKFKILDDAISKRVIYSKPKYVLRPFW